jgi:hypothetical protein
MNVTKVEYTKPYHSRLPDYLKGDGVSTVDNVREYHIKSATESVQGFAGGYVRKNPDGLWVARYYEHTDWQPPAQTRDGAVNNLLPLASQTLADFRKMNEAEDKAREERFGKARQLAGMFPDGWNVSDTNAWKPGTDRRYSVSIADLKEEQVRSIIHILNDGMGNE